MRIRSTLRRLGEAAAGILTFVQDTWVMLLIGAVIASAVVGFVVRTFD